MAIGTHNPAAIQLTVNGILIRDLLEDGVKSEPQSPVGEPTARLGGGFVYSYNPDKTRKFMIACDPTGQGYRDLSAQRLAFEQQLQAGAALPKLPFAFVDPANGTNIVGLCVFLNRPTAQGARAVESATFELLVEVAGEQHGSLIV